MPQICIDPEVIAENGLCYLEQQAAIHGITVGCPEPPPLPTSCLPTSQIYPDYLITCLQIDCPFYAPPSDPCELRPWGEFELAVCFDFDHAVRVFAAGHYGQSCNGTSSDTCPGEIPRRFQLDGVSVLPDEFPINSEQCGGTDPIDPEQLFSGEYVFYNIPAGPHTLTWGARPRNVYPDEGCRCGGGLKVWFYREEPCDGYVPPYYVGPCVT